MSKHESFSEKERETLNKLLDDYKLSPQQLAVIAALMFNAVYVKSVLVDIDQTVVILLEGSLRKQTKNTEKLMNEIRGFNVGQLFELLNRRRPI